MCVWGIISLKPIRLYILWSVVTSYAETNHTQSLQNFDWTDPRPVQLIITRAPHHLWQHSINRLKTLRRVCF